MFGSHLFADTLFAYRAAALRRWQAICVAATNWDEQSVDGDAWADQSVAGDNWVDQAKNNIPSEKC